MSSMKKQVSLLLTICMIVTMLFPTSISAVGKPTVVVDFVDTGSTISYEENNLHVWKMVVQAGAPVGVEVLSTVFSMDASVIKPVEPISATDYLPSTITFSATEPLNSGCLIPTGSYAFNKPYAALPDLWLNNVSDGSMAFVYGVTTNGAAINPSYYDTRSMFEFYFIFTGVPYQGCIKLESQTGAGTYINRFYSDPAEQNGILLRSGGADYVYSSTETAEIDYDIAYPAGLLDKVSSIGITTPPTTTSYIEGHSFDPAGMVVTATYADDTTAVIPSGEYEYAPTGELATSDTAITVTYTDPFDGSEYTDTQAITVAAKEISSIDAVFNQAGATIFTSNSLDSLEQYLTVTATFNDSTTGELDPTRYALSGSLAGDGTAGTRTITVTAGDSKTDTFDVNVTAVALSSIDATFTQGGITYYTSSPLVSLKSNLVVTGINNDASTFGIGADDYTLTGTMTAGVSTIIVTHTASGKTDTFTVNVTAKAVDSLSLSGVLGKIYYNAFESFVPTGLVVTANYNDGSSAVVTDDVTFTYANENSSFYAGETYIDINYGGKTVRQGGLSVAKLQIPKPAVTNDPLTYNGNAQSPTIAEDEAYIITGNSQTAAGNYTATVALDDKINYEWTDSTTTNLDLAWSIGQKTLTVRDGTYAVSKSYDGTTGAGIATGELALDGIVPSDDVSATVSSVPAYPAANAGTHTITLTVGLDGDEAGNYNLGSYSYDFTSATILQALIAKPTVTNAPLTYTGSAQQPTIAANAAYTITGNSQTDARSYTATVALNDKANYDWVGGGDDELSLAWSIMKADPSVTVEYTGGTLYSSSPLPALTLGAGSTAGTATLDAGQTLLSGTNSYNWSFAPTDTTNYNPKTGTISLAVVQVTLESIAITTPPTKTTYDAFEAFDPTGMVVTATYNNAETNIVTAQVTFDYMNDSSSFRAGETSITTSFTQDSVTKTASVPVTVNKVQIAKPAVTNGPLTYTGSAQSPTIATNAAYAISENSQTAAGNYTAVVALDDTDNYEWSDSTITDLSLSWSIGKKILTVGDGTYEVSKTYDGTTSAGTGTGSLALAGIVGSDAVSVVVGTIPVYPNANAATYTITLPVSLSGAASSNYDLGSGSYAFTSAEIVPAVVAEPIVTNGTLTYTGSSQSPTIAANGAYTISGNSQTNAGDYQATVALVNTTNYVWSAGGTAPLSLDWSIEKADPTITVTYTGPQLYSSSAMPVLTVTGTAGTAVLDGGQILMAGTNNYNWTYTPTDTTNYNGETGTVSLNVVAVALESIAITTQPTKTIYDAFEAFDPTGMVVTATYNNAATNDVTLQVIFDYLNDSNSFRAGETSVTVSFTQDAVIKTTSVPVTVNKLQIAKPVVSGALIYNGNAQSPTIAANDAYTITGNSQTTAGNYTATVALKDTDNYEWVGGGNDDLSLAWSITPKNLSATATVAAIPDKLWTGSALEPAVTVADGATTLTAGSGYDAAYSSNTDSGIAVITITFKGNYTGTKVVNFNINNKTEVSSRAIVTNDIADPAIKTHLANEGKYTVGAAARKSANVNEFTVAVQGTATLASYASSDPAQGSGNWIGVIMGGFKVNGGAAAGTTDLFYSADGDTYTQLGAADLTEVQSVGGADGEFILWLKSEAVGAGVDRYIATDATGANETKITVTFTAYVPSGGGGGGLTPPPATEPPVTSGTTTTGTTTVTPTTTGTTSTVIVNNATLSTAVTDTVNAAKDTQTAASVVVSVPTPPETKKVEVTIPKAPVNTLANSDPAASLTVQTGVASVAFDGAALQTITEEAQGASLTIVTVSVEKETLTAAQQDLVGDRPVLDLAVMSGSQIISDFKGGKATVTVPYTLREGETGEGITIWFMTDDGNLTEVECAYDAATGSVRFTTGHFSQYVLAHFPFTDMKDSEWYYENVVYAYTNGLMNGTQPTTFSPESDITRGMVVTILWRMAGQPAAAKHSFKDVQFSWYDQAISWAFANNIVSGYGPDRFGPENLITREEMAKILRNYAIYAGRTVDQSAEIQGFGDAARVSGWAVESLKWAVGSGIIGGTNRNTLEPMGQATRAQVAAILQRFIQSEAE